MKIAPFGMNLVRGVFDPRMRLKKDKKMLISDARKFVGQTVEVTYVDRRQLEIVEVAEVFDVNFVPLYGPCLITDVGDIRLDRVHSMQTYVAETFRAA